MALTVTPRGIAATLMVVVVAVVCVRLGFWQLDRLEERRARNAEVASAFAQQPLSLDAELAAAAATDPERVLHRRVELRGRFLSDSEVVLRGRASLGKPGVHVVTPMQLEGTRYAVLVNRGWAPSADAMTVDLASLTEPGMHRILGLAQPLSPDELPSGSVVTGEDAPVRSVRRLTHADVRAHSGVEILPLVVTAFPDTIRHAAPFRVDPPPADEGNHLAYAIQWFSFAVIAVGGWAILVFRRGGTRKKEGVGTAIEP
jgi:surfeit locus 1 family protein